MAVRIGGLPFKKRLLPGLPYPIPISSGTPAPRLTFRSASSGGDSSFGASSISATLPDGEVQNDLDIIEFGTSSIAPTAAPTHTTPTGYSLAGTFTFTSAAGVLNSRVSVFYRIAPASPGAVTLQASANCALGYTRCCYDNPDTAAPFGQITFAAFSGTTTPTASSITTTKDEALVVTFLTQGTAQAASAPQSQTERVDNATVAFAVADNIQPNAGATGPKAWTIPTSTDGSIAIAEFWSEPGAAVDFDVTAAAPIALAGSLSITGNPGVPNEWEFEPPLSVQGMTGALSIAGDIQISAGTAFNLSPAAPVAIAGGLTAAGNLQFGTAFDLSPQAPISIGGTLLAAGNIQTATTLNISQQAPIAVAGTLLAAGNLQIASALNLTPQAPIAIGGQLTIAGNVETSFNLSAASPIAIAGSLAAAGTLQFSTAFNLAPAAPVAIAGGLVITGNLETSTAFNVSQVAPIAVAGAVLVAGDIQIGAPVVFELVPQTPIALAGAMTIAGNVQALTALNLAPTAPIAMSGLLAIAGDIQITPEILLNLTPTAPIALLGSLGLTGNIQAPALFDLAAQAPVALAGGLALAGDIEIALPVVFDLAPAAPIALAGSVAMLGGIEIASLFNLTTTQPIAIVGTLLAAGDIQAGTSFALQPQAPIALQGGLAIAGNISAGEAFNLFATAPVSLLGSVSLAAQLQILVPATVPDVTGLSQADAIAALEAAGFVVAIVTDSSTVAAGTVLSQDPAGGTSSFVGFIVTITVSSGYALATDPKLIAKKRKPNVSFRGVGTPTPRKKREEQPEPVKAKASPLLLGLMARGLALPTPFLPEPVLVPVLPAEPLPAAIEVPEPEVAPTPEQQLAARVQELEQQMMQLQADLAALRQPPEPAQATARDPVHEALHALLPALSEPIDLDAVPDAPEEVPPEAAAAPAEPPRMTREQIDAENERRARLAAERLL